MCGIAGIFNWMDAPIDRLRLEKMVNALAHRGPDGSGVFFEGPIALGHRRLAIIDPSQGQQPMVNQSGSIAISFNGEIYNYKELQTELQNLGYRFRTDSDTEVILHAYDAWGEECHSRFNGMWALAIWDSLNRKLILSRDRLGEKPLYFVKDEAHLIFASEPKGIFAYGYPAQLDREQLEIYLVLGYVPAPYSFFKGIRKLEAGQYLTVSGNGIVQHRHWEFPQIPEGDMRVDEAAVKEEFDFLLKDSVRLRMRSDVPFGAFLSGGLDSTSIVALMREHSNNISTFTIGFKEKAFDERGLANVVAEKFETNHHEIVVGLTSFEEAIERTLEIYDEPFGDSSAIPSAHVCQFASQHVKMVLTGDGGDEVLSGYPSYQAEKFGSRYQQLPIITRKILEGSLAALTSFASGRLMYQLQRIVGVLKATNYSFPKRLLTKSACIDLCYLEEVFDERGQARPIEDYIDEVFRGCTFNDPFYKLMYWHHKVSLPERMLTKVDRVSMAHSLECRAPFLDSRLVELLSGTSKNIKMPGFQRKHLLRATVGKFLPKEILNAPKKGFIPPLRSWVNEEMIKKCLKNSCLDQFGINSLALEKLSRLNGEGKRDFGHFLWIALLLTGWGTKPELAPIK